MRLQPIIDVALRAALLLGVLVASVPGAQAQGAATLVADQVTVTADNRLIAQGNVEVLYDGARLSAARITYDQATDLLQIDGPIFILAPDGMILTADSATLDPQLRNGLLRGARLVLEQHLQLAANRIDRVDGRYSQLTGAAATSCRVCGNRAPLWDIRARRVVHDEEARQLYFENATFRIRGVPVFWLPRMRLPDPTLTRATGFLIPRFRTSDQLGFGIKLPYFIRLGDHRDITLTPYISPRTRTLEARYRQAFLRGAVEVNAAVSNDDLHGEETRRYLFAEGDFDLGRDFRLGFNIETVSDPAYLLDYGYGDQDRLRSAVDLRRVRQDDLLLANLTYYTTLRNDEPSASLPAIVATLGYERRLYPAAAGGALTLSGDIETFVRREDDPGPDARDVTRLGVGALWRRDWLLGPGILAETATAMNLDYYRVAQDPAFDEQVLRAAPAVAVTLRWPLTRTTATGVAHVIEPAVALGWSAVTGNAVPNEDSTLVEFDEGNLLALDRFPGDDARESGARASLGLTWTRTAPNGVASSLTLGRVLRDQADDRFSTASGLTGTASDWLIAGHLDLPRGFSFNLRTVLDDDFTFAKTGARLDWVNPRFDVGAAYVWLPADAQEDRDNSLSEWAVDAAYRIDERWSISGDARYDIVEDRFARTGLGVGWRNECVTVDLSVSRRYTSSDTVDPSTDYGLSVGLSGFSAGRPGARVAGRCPQ